MDLMNIRRGLLAQMSSGTKVKTGTFVGSNNNTQDFDIGFDPDVFYADCGLDFYETGWTGQRNVTFIKNTLIVQSRHNNDTNNSPFATINGKFDSEHPYGINVEAYCPYASYFNGVFTVTNSTNNALTRFISGQTYEWVAIKYT